MITFTLGVLAAIVVGMLVWLTIDAVKSSKKIKQLEKEKENLWLEIQHRCDSIERDISENTQTINRRVDDNYSYTDSRFDKLVNAIERNYVSKIDKTSNTISYNS
jgi:hypothetical protein